MSEHETYRPVALVTGGAGDIGRAIARRFLDDGGRVLLVDRSTSALQKAADELDSTDLVTHVADVTIESEVAGYVAAALGRFGTIDAFFNNAGIEGAGDPVVDYPVSTFEQVLSVNVVGVFLGLQHVLPHMLERRAGAVVNTASVAGLRGIENMSGYAASKHAVVGLTRSAALEVGPRGVRVNAVCPSGVAGRMIDSIAAMTTRTADDDGKGAIATRNVAGRLALPAEIAAIAVYLTGPDTVFVNGATWEIDAGRTAR